MKNYLPAHKSKTSDDQIGNKENNSRINNAGDVLLHFQMNTIIMFYYFFQGKSGMYFRIINWLSYINFDYVDDLHWFAGPTYYLPFV